MKSVHITEAKVLLLEVSTTTLSPSIWHHGVSTHDWGKVSTAGGLYYYIESQYLTTEVSTYPLDQVLLLEVSITTLSKNIWHTNSVHITEAKYLLLEVSTTTLSPCMMSVHITEAKVLLLEVSSNTLRTSIWHN